MSQALRKLTGSLNKSQCLMIFINQLRMKIGVMFGNPETTTGGNALKFYSSVRLRVSRIGAIKEAGRGGQDPDVVGNRTRVNISKNKLAPPFRDVEFDILYGRGISRAGDVLDLASDAGIIEKSGSWYSFESERIGQGREKARAFLEENAAMLDRVTDLVLARHKVPRRGAWAADAAGAAAAAARGGNGERAATAVAAKGNGGEAKGVAAETKATAAEAKAAAAETKAPAAEAKPAPQEGRAGRPTSGR
jgi:recombination protein RecA